jgi:hypothetical protein
MLNISNVDLNKILSRIEELEINPYPTGYEKLIGHELYRIRL